MTRSMPNEQTIMFVTMKETMTAHDTDESLDDEIEQFVWHVGDLADRVRALPDNRVTSDELLVACFLMKHFNIDELFRADYDGFPAEQDVTLLRSALAGLGEIEPAFFAIDAAVKPGPIQRNPIRRKALGSHFSYLETSKGVVLISHKETKLRRLLSAAEKEFVRGFYIHEMLDDVCNCCREKMERGEPIVAAPRNGDTVN